MLSVCMFPALCDCADLGNGDLSGSDGTSWLTHVLGHQDGDEEHINETSFSGYLVVDFCLLIR